MRFETMFCWGFRDGRMRGAGDGGARSSLPPIGRRDAQGSSGCTGTPAARHPPMLGSWYVRAGLELPGARFRGAGYGGEALGIIRRKVRNGVTGKSYIARVPARSGSTPSPLKMNRLAHLDPGEDWGAPASGARPYLVSGDADRLA